MQPREAQQAFERDRVGRTVADGEHRAGRGVEDGGGVRVAMGVDADDMIDALCEHAHATTSRDSGVQVVGLDRRAAGL